MSIEEYVLLPLFLTKWNARNYFFPFDFLSPFLSAFFGKFLSSEELEFLEKETIYSEKEKKNEEGKKYKKMKK